MIQFRFILWRKVHFLTKKHPTPISFPAYGPGEERRPRLLLQTHRAAVYRYRLPSGPAHSSKPAACCYSGRMEQTDRRTDGRTPCRCKDPAAYYATCVRRRTSKKNNSCKNISHFLLTSGADLRVTRVISRPSPWRVSLFYVIIMRVT